MQGPSAEVEGLESQGRDCGREAADAGAKRRGGSSAVAGDEAEAEACIT